LALSKRQFAQVLKKRSLVISNNPKSLIAEQIRIIRTNFEFISRNKQKSSLIVTSPGFGEGKTTITGNIGISMAEQGKKVLIVDADLLNPGMHTLFKFKNSIGLVNVLKGEIKLEDAINHTETEGLDLITSGSMLYNPSSIISRSSISVLIKNALEEYDLIIFDSPPVNEIADAKIIANLCDGVIFVVKHRKTQEEKALECKKLLELAGANIVGTILNEKK
jgi:protein-tyrosine kinase